MSYATNLTLRVDKNIKQEADELFASLGMSVSTAFNIFLRQSLRIGGLPFEVLANRPNAETRAAMKEAEALIRNPKAKRHSTMESLISELNS